MLTVNQAHLFCLMLLVEWNLLTSFHPVILIHLMSATNDLLRFRENYILIYLRSKLHCKHKRFTYIPVLSKPFWLYLRYNFISLFLLEPRAVTNYLFLYAAFAPWTHSENFHFIQVSTGLWLQFFFPDQVHVSEYGRFCDFQSNTKAQIRNLAQYMEYTQRHTHTISEI